MRNVIFMGYYTFVLLYIPLHHPKERTVCQNSQQKSGLFGKRAIFRPYNYQPIRDTSFYKNITLLPAEWLCTWCSIIMFISGEKSFRRIILFKKPYATVWLKSTNTFNCINQACKLKA